LIAGALVAAAGAWSSSARAELTFYEKDNWAVGTDGRINGFYSYTTGKGRPLAMPPALPGPAPGAGIEHPVDNKNSFESSRIRSGFVSTVLGFNLRRKVSEDLAFKGRLAIWWTIEQRRTIGAGINQVDGREAYLSLEGPWGGVLAGRTLGLFSRGNIELNAMYGHGNGLGHPCDVANFGPGCGHVGFGVQYPGFTPSIRYYTPNLSGFRVEVGIFDPVTLPGRFEITPWPRIEGEAAYQYQTDEDQATIKVFASGTWQRMKEYNEAPNVPRTLKTADPYGLSYGVRGKYGPFKAGVAGFTGAGLGITYPLENTQYPADESLELRTTDGILGQIMLSFSNTDISLGAGISTLHETDYDKSGGETGVRANIIETQRGLSAGVYQHVDALVFALEYFRADYKWVYDNTQELNIINAGATLKW
jgi:hypothetical protein